MPGDEHLDAITYLHVRRFLWLHCGQDDALAPHEVEGFVTELRVGLNALEQRGPDVSTHVREVRRELRRLLGTPEGKPDDPADD